MEDPKERLVTSISPEELERRWKAAREWMKAEGVDYLLMRNDEEYFGGYVKWFTDIPARHSYPFTVIFPGGYYTEIARPFSLGEPSQETKDTFAAVLEAETVTLDLLKPGADPKEIRNAHNAFLRRKGLAPEGRLYAHGEGYDLVERPAIRYDETMILRPGMNLAVHPSGKSKNVWTTMCNNYLITENGVSPCLHKTPKEIIIVA